MLLWVYPQGPLPGAIDFSLAIEADHEYVRLMVARDAEQVPHGIALAVGDEPSDLGDVLSMWGIGFPDAGELPVEWFS